MSADSTTVRRDENDEQVIVGIDGDGVDVAIAVEDGVDPEQALATIADAATEVSSLVSESKRKSKTVAGLCRRGP